MQIENNNTRMRSIKKIMELYLVFLIFASENYDLQLKQVQRASNIVAK